MKRSFVIDFKREEWSGRTGLDELLSFLQNRELCSCRPDRIRLDRDWFSVVVRELAASHVGFSFNVDNFTLWGIPVALDWALTKDTGQAERDL